MRILIGIPCLYNAEATRQCIESVVHKDVSIILMDNGAEQNVKNVLSQYADAPNVMYVSNPTNIYVNPAWNHFIKSFLSTSDYDYLIILNSDLILQHDWLEVLKNRLEKHPHEITLPVITPEFPVFNTEYQIGTKVDCCTAGVFICLSRACATLINPIPENIRVWYGDNWIFDYLRGCGFETVVAPNLYANHFWGGSQSVQKTPDIAAIIESDKVQWRNAVEPLMQEKIKEFNS